MFLSADISLLAIYLVALFFSVFWLLVFIEDKKVERLDKLEKLPFVSIIIPAWNEEECIKDTIDSALNLDYPKDKIEIIVIDHGSIDKTGEIADSYGKKIKTLHISRTDKDRKGVAMNAGLKAAKGEFFASLDADSTVDKDALKNMLHYFTKEDIAAVLPLMKIKNKKKFWHRVQHYEYTVNMFYKSLMGRLDSIHVSPGPFSVFRTKVIRDIGEYDPYNLTEDLELTMRLQKHSYRVIQVMDAVVYTSGMDNAKDMYKQRNRWYKGAIYNAVKYKDMMFNKKYGDFGLVKVPMIILSGIFAIVILFRILDIFIFTSLKTYIYNLSLINFDILTLIKNFSLDINIFDFDFLGLFILLTAAFASLFILKYSHKYSNEKIFKGVVSIPSLIFYIVVYSLFLGVVWTGIAIDLVKGRKQKW